MTVCLIQSDRNTLKQAFPQPEAPQTSSASAPVRSSLIRSLPPQDDAVAVDTARDPALEVRQREGRLAVAPIGRSQEREQGLVLVDGQQLAVAKSPALGREVERHDLDFADKRFAHSRLLLGPGGMPTTGQFHGRGGKTPCSAMQ